MAACSLEYRERTAGRDFGQADPPPRSSRDNLRRARSILPGLILNLRKFEKLGNASTVHDRLGYCVGAQQPLHRLF